MLRRMVAIFVMAILVTATAFADIEITGYRVDNQENVFSIGYNYPEKNMISIMAYDVSKIENPTIKQSYVNEETTPIIAMWQEWVDGQFDLNIKPDYTGKTMVVIATDDGTTKRILIDIKAGMIDSLTIPNHISGQINADGAERVLQNGDAIRMDSNAKLINAVVNANAGSFTIGTTNVSGRVTFDADGNVLAEAGDTISLEAPAANGKRTVGFIHGEAYDRQADKRMLKISTPNGYFSQTFNTAGLVGNFMFGAVINGVPDSVQASDFTIEIIEVGVDGKNGIYKKSSGFSALFGKIEN